jgi:hypothetical protein
LEQVRGSASGAVHVLAVAYYHHLRPHLDFLEIAAAWRRKLLNSLTSAGLKKSLWFS